MKTEIPTAEEVLEAFYQDQYNKTESGQIYPQYYPKYVIDAMISFAHFHTNNALSKAADDVHLTDLAYEFLQEGAEQAIDRDSILNCYDPSNIK